MWSRPTRARGLKRRFQIFERKHLLVAPHAGAWIETSRTEKRIELITGSRPTRARGLKLVRLNFSSAPATSRPTRARGLKRNARRRLRTLVLSRPTRARGLKRFVEQSLRINYGVAPHAGAWIETHTDVFADLMPQVSRPTRARGLKLGADYHNRSRNASRPTRARGLKPSTLLLTDESVSVAPHAGAWIETISKRQSTSPIAGRAPRGRVD